MYDPILGYDLQDPWQRDTAEQLPNPFLNPATFPVPAPVEEQPVAPVEPPKPPEPKYADVPEGWILDEPKEPKEPEVQPKYADVPEGWVLEKPPEKKPVVLAGLSKPTTLESVPEGTKQNDWLDSINEVMRGASSEGLLMSMEGLYGIVEQRTKGTFLEGLFKPAGEQRKEIAAMRERVRNRLPVDKDFAESAAGGVLEGLGQLTNLPLYAVPGVGEVSSFGQLYQEAKEDYKQTMEAKGLPIDEAQADRAALEYATGAGLLEVAADRLLVGKFFKAAKKAGWTVGKTLHGIGEMAASGAISEGGQQTWLNTVANSLENYDPERSYLKDVPESALVGGLVGGVGGGVAETGGYLAGKAQAALAPPPPPPGAPPPPPAVPGLAEAAATFTQEQAAENAALLRAAAVQAPKLPTAPEIELPITSEVAQGLVAKAPMSVEVPIAPEVAQGLAAKAPMPVEVPVAPEIAAGLAAKGVAAKAASLPPGINVTGHDLATGTPIYSGGIGATAIPPTVGMQVQSAGRTPGEITEVLPDGSTMVSWHGKTPVKVTPAYLRLPPETPPAAAVPPVTGAPPAAAVPPVTPAPPTDPVQDRLKTVNEQLAANTDPAGADIDRATGVNLRAEREVLESKAKATADVTLVKDTATRVETAGAPKTAEALLASTSTEISERHEAIQEAIGLMPQELFAEEQEAAVEAAKGPRRGESGYGAPTGGEVIGAPPTAAPGAAPPAPGAAVPGVVPGAAPTLGEVVPETIIRTGIKGQDAVITRPSEQIRQALTGVKVDVEVRSTNGERRILPQDASQALMDLKKDKTGLQLLTGCLK